MIIYCAADPVYFNLYFELWINQLNKFYDNDKIIALYKPDKTILQKCEKHNVESIDVTNLFPDNPTREHFYLMRWISLPYYKKVNILCTQINCLAVKKQSFPKITVEQWRIQRQKRGYLGGVSASIFTSNAAKKVVAQAKTMLAHPPKTDHPMNIWQIENLTQYQHKSEQQLKIENKQELQDYTHWITARTSTVWTAQQKINALLNNI
jgi:hypothetical protein|tara:strand:- start:1249 stop:1872 length:624 start_codon:yes stop_codon:yes gene_type:complete